MSTNLYPIVVFFSFLVSLIIVAFLRKIYYYLRYKKRFYIIPKVGIKGVTNIAIVIAISVSIIILITIGSADLLNVIFRSWPGTRMTIEGILIKIGGLLFGPFIGMFIGLITDLLTVVLTAGVFHYGYLVSAMAFGLMSGLVSDIFKSTRVQGWSRALLGTFLLLITGAIMFAFFYLQISTTGVNEYMLSFLGLNIPVKIMLLVQILCGFIGLNILSIWVVYFGRLIYNSKKTSKQSKEGMFFSSFITVLVAVVVCNAMINVIMMPSFDAELSSIQYKEWLIIRALLFIPEIIFNFVIIMPIYKIALMKLDYDYHTNLIESIKYPIYVN